MIIVALDNEKIFKNIKEEFEEEVYKYDIVDMENVVEYISGIDDVVLITKDKLNGRLTKEIYIKQLRLANKNCKIILLTEELDSKYKSFLFSNEVFNIIEGEEINFNKIKEEINKDNIVYKKDVVENVSNIFTKEVIAVYGSSGSGKSYISLLLSKKLASFNLDTLLLDMDVENSCQDIYTDIKNENVNIMDIVENIDKKRNIEEFLTNKLGNNKNISYITSNLSIFDYKNKMNINYYESIFKAIESKFKFIVVDLPASPFLDVVPYTVNKATKILFVINANYISLRQSIKYLELLNKLYKVPKSKINIIINKFNKNSLPIEIIRSILKEYEIKEVLEFNNDLEGYINGNKNAKLEYNFNNVISNIKINYNTKKVDIKSRILKMIKERKLVYDN